MNAFRVWAVGAVAVLLAGCGGGTGSLAGRVTLDGKPVVAGTVTVVAADGTVCLGEIGPDGAYKVADVPTGPAKVAVNSPDRNEKTSLEKAGFAPRSAADRSGGGNPKGWFPLDPRLADPLTSGIGIDVGRGRTTFEIELK